MCSWTGSDFAVISLSTAYLNRPNWLQAGTPFITGLLFRASQPTIFYDGPRSGHQRRCNIATGYAYEHFLGKVDCDRVYFFVHRAHCDRFRFSTPSGAPVHMKVECLPRENGGLKMAHTQYAHWEVPPGPFPARPMVA